jgi:DNA-binding transcriptional ArsR family regulator
VRELSFNHMVEYSFSLDNLFSALSDPTRRDILARVARQELAVGEIAEHYHLTFAAVSKHLKVMEKAKLIIKRRRGKQQLVMISPMALKSADDYLEYYRKLWEARLDSLDQYLSQGDQQ